MNLVIAAHKEDFEKGIAFLEQELSALRTGRATPALVEHIRVHAYDTMQELVGLASITTPDQRSILISPWDKSVLKNIEKAIQESDIGLMPIVQGDGIRITIPAMTEESRKKLAKVVGEKAEEAKVSIRGVRDDVRNEVIQGEKDGQITEDDKYRILEELDEVTATYNERIKTMAAEKEQEIMTM